MQAFRKIHYMSMAAYLAALFHSLYSGTDSMLGWVQIMYLRTSLFTIFFVFFFTQWMFTLYFRKKELLSAKK